MTLRSKSIGAGAAALLAVGAFAASAAGPAAALPAEATWSDSGLREMVRISGHLQWSIDGLGTEDGAGTLQVQKPAGATVIAAYFMAAQTNLANSATPGIALNGSPVTFDSLVEDPDGSYGFNNAFGDVTEAVSSTIDAAPAGLVDLAVDEGATATEGTALVVIFEDPSVDYASIILNFGRSDTDGDDFALAFPALIQPQLDDLRLSLGISYSYQPDQDSLVTVNGKTMADEAGHFDDCKTYPDCNDGALFTVGGVGDDLANPTVPAPSDFDDDNDDELYSLAPFVTVGDTQIDVTSRNPSGDDNLFFAGFYLHHVAVEGGIIVGDAVNEPPFVPTMPVLQDSDSDVVDVEPARLPDTGVDSGSLSWLALAAFVLMGAGAALVAVRRTRTSA